MWSSMASGSRKKAKYPIHIAISGRSGCGNTTVSRLLSRRLGVEMINYTFRSVAREDGLTFEEVCRLAEKNDDMDRRVDQTQVELARRAPGAVLGSRLAVWMLEDADLKVYLKGSPEVRAGRILAREGGSLEKKMAETAARDARDHARYQTLYGIDNEDTSAADLVINTDHWEAARIVDMIETAVRGLFPRS